VPARPVSTLTIRLHRSARIQTIHNCLIAAASAVSTGGSFTFVEGADGLQSDMSSTSSDSSACSGSETSATRNRARTGQTLLDLAYYGHRAASLRDRCPRGVCGIGGQSLAVYCPFQDKLIWSVCSRCGFLRISRTSSECFCTSIHMIRFADYHSGQPTNYPHSLQSQQPCGT
jgi:hypothetical protein